MSSLALTPRGRPPFIAADGAALLSDGRVAQNCGRLRSRQSRLACQTGPAQALLHLTVAYNGTLPPDIQHRLSGLGGAIAAASSDVEFAYLFGSAATGMETMR
jgi:hypothetical protein